jgi:cell division protease FtsH
MMKLRTTLLAGAILLLLLLTFALATGAQGATTTVTILTPVALTPTATTAVNPLIPATGTTSALTLPAGTTLSTLGTFYRDVRAHRVHAATLDTYLAVILFSVGANNYAAQYVAQTSPSLQPFLLRAGVNLTITQAPTIGPPLPTVPEGLPWSPIVVLLITASTLYLLFIRRLYPHRLIPQRCIPRPLRRKKEVRVSSGVIASDSPSHDVPTTTFADVAGCPEAVAELRELIAFMTDKKKYEALGATTPTGALLVGPPGTGKTLLARALAGEASIPFFACSGSDFAGVYVGTGPKNVRDLFAKAKKAGRAIVFIDEIDAVARVRSSENMQAADAEHDNTLIALLDAMDGFIASEVIVVAATNRPDILDPAITRPGRLDRRIEVPLPDWRGRQDILRVHARTRPLDADVDLERVARRTPMMSGADLANVVNEAAIFAAREDASAVHTRHIDAAIATVMMGRARTSAVVTQDDRVVTAWHEAGHTVCAYMQEAGHPPVSVSIIPRGAAGGVTWTSEGDNKFMRRSKAAALLVTALGGRAAEGLLLADDYTQGATSDLQTATDLATQMSARYGMTDYGLMIRDAHQHGFGANDGLPAVIEDLLAKALTESTRILREYSAFTRAIATALLEEETLDNTDLDTIYASVGSPHPVDATTTLRAIYASDARTVGEVATALTPHHVAVG